MLPLPQALRHSLPTPPPPSSSLQALLAAPWTLRCVGGLGCARSVRGAGAGGSRGAARFAAKSCLESCPPRAPRVPRESHARALDSRVALWQQGPGSSSLSASVPARALPALVRTPVATLAREGSVAPHSLVGRERGLKLSRDLDVTAPTPPHTPFLSSPQVTGSR